jgi:hypothetical protein
VASSFDAGIGPKDWAAADMIAVRVMGPMKVAVVGAPSYFERRRPLRAHSMILPPTAAFNIDLRRMGLFYHGPSSGTAGPRGCRWRAQ